MERSLGSLEGQYYDFGHEDDESNGTIEPMERLMRRASEGLELLRAIDVDTVLLVSHGSFGKALQTVLNPDVSYSEPPNAQIIKLL
jgi:broad specificity phosphatase PhoE